MKKTWGILAAVGAVLATTPHVLTPQDDTTKRTLMRAKAGYAHRLLDAVVQENFEVMEDQAFRLKAVTETADWDAMEAPRFVRESDAFIRATDQLFRAARDKNGNAAALAYVDLTLRCVKCHRLLREE